jgi:hypothetical protein
MLREVRVRSGMLVCSERHLYVEDGRGKGTGVNNELLFVYCAYTNMSIFAVVDM